MSSSSFGSRSRSSRSPTLLPVKPKPREMPLGRRTCIGTLVINEASSFLLVKPKTEPPLLPMKTEHEAMSVDKETVLKWAWNDYVRKEMERERRTLEEIAASLTELVFRVGLRHLAHRCVHPLPHHRCGREPSQFLGATPLMSISSYSLFSLPRRNLACLRWRNPVAASSSPPDPVAHA
ncbi:SEC12-like protein 2 [Hordeum vulgare]|nr:SEC12-like protein 2 [Hordeum vulgare]